MTGRSIPLQGFRSPGTGLPATMPPRPGPTEGKPSSAWKSTRVPPLRSPRRGMLSHARRGGASSGPPGRSCPSGRFALWQASLKCSLGAARDGGTRGGTSPTLPSGESGSRSATDPRPPTCSIPSPPGSFRSGPGPTGATSRSSWRNSWTRLSGAWIPGKPPGSPPISERSPARQPPARSRSWAAAACWCRGPGPTELLMGAVRELRSTFLHLAA